MKSNYHKYYLGLTIILLILLIGTIKDYGLVSKNSYTITFFDLKLGESSLIKTPQNKKIIIDGGYGDNLIPKLSKHMGFFERYIDLVIISHPQSDHIGGLLQLIKRYDIGEIWISTLGANNPEFNELMKIIQKRDIPIKIVNEKSDIIFDENLYIDVLFPFDTTDASKYKNINNLSIVFKLIIMKGTGAESFLFTGDIEKKTELEILKKVPNLKSDYMKAPHHGSKTSSSTGFILAVSPQTAIIGASKNNKFGHPHKLITNRYNSLGVKILITGINGDIAFKN